ASPRNPKLDTLSRSSTARILLVACACQRCSRSTRVMPKPLSATRTSSLPPSSSVTVILVAPASRAFSTSSFTTLAGRSITSPAAIFWMVNGLRALITEADMQANLPLRALPPCRSVPSRTSSPPGPPVRSTPKKTNHGGRPPCRRPVCAGRLLIPIFHTNFVCLMHEGHVQNALHPPVSERTGHQGARNARAIARNRHRVRHPVQVPRTDRHPHEKRGVGARDAR